MKYLNTDEMARKYIEAETSLEEEATLRKNLLSDDRADAYTELKALFGYYQIQKSATPTAHFRNPSTEMPERKTRIISMPWIAAAASVVILVAAWFIFNPAGNNASADTFSDPEIAAQNAAEAIQLLSVELNKGRTLAMDQMKEFDSFNKYLNIF